MSITPLLFTLDTDCSAMTTAALRQRLDEVLEERDSLLKEKEEALVLKEGIEKELQTARVDREFGHRRRWLLTGHLPQSI